MVRNPPRISRSRLLVQGGRGREVRGTSLQSGRRRFPYRRRFDFLIDHCDYYPTLGKATQAFSHDSVGVLTR